MCYFIGLGLVILLAGCATTTTNYYTKTIGTWRGGNAETLMKTWGTPDDKIASANGNTVYIYKTMSYSQSPTSPSPTVGVSVGANGRPVMVSSPNTNTVWSRGMSISCVTAFVVNKQGIITAVQSRGDHCFGGETFAKQMKNPI